MGDVLDRMAPKITVDGVGCWVWTASLRDGYGQVRVGSSVRSAHRVMYEQLVGPVADGLDLDHLCRRRECVNPDHLEQVTRRDNLLRSPVTMASLHSSRRDCGVESCRACVPLREAAA